MGVSISRHHDACRAPEAESQATGRDCDSRYPSEIPFHNEELMSETTANSGTPEASRAALLTVFLVVFIDLLGFGIVLPLMPRYAKNLLEPAGIPEQLHGLTIGGLLAVFSLMQFIFAPVWGRVSDRVGRKPILILGLAGSVVF